MASRRLENETRILLVDEVRLANLLLDLPYGKSKGVSHSVLTITTISVTFSTHNHAQILSNATLRTATMNASTAKGRKVKSSQANTEHHTMSLSRIRQDSRVKVPAEFSY